MKFIVCTVGFVIVELLVGFLFSAISQVFYKKHGINFKSISKGIIERLFLVVALLNNYPHALTLFSALKLGTRLRRPDEKDNEKAFNDYYLIGNLVSVSIAIGYVHLFSHYDAIIALIQKM